VSGTADLIFSKPKDWLDTNDVATVVPDDNMYGVPWVFGAKKGFPNFNEFAMQTVFQVTRRLEISRSAASAAKDILPSKDPTCVTNMSYVVGLSNLLGVELWNSYVTNYGRQVQVLVACDLSMTLSNDLGITVNLPANWITPVLTNIPVNAWAGYKPGTTASLIVPLQTNVVLVPDRSYTAVPSAFYLGTNITWDTSQTFKTPEWKAFISCRIRCIMIDPLTSRVIDYVHFNGLGPTRNVAEIRDPDEILGFDGLWSINRPGGSLGPPRGIINQIEVGQGHYGVGTGKWISNTADPSTSVQNEVNLFAALYHVGPAGLKNTNTVIQVPYTPTRKMYLQTKWQANDPLVHYMADDLVDFRKASQPEPIKPPNKAGPGLYELGIGRVNDRYQPWDGNPENPTDKQEDANRYNAALKDPGVRNSDGWTFPTNGLPNIGWLGRVHRGTPWQTIYMKSGDVDLGAWTNWASNINPADALRSRPVTDRVLFDVFTTAFNENASRGQLSINQTNLAAWSALFSGVAVLTNSTSETLLLRGRQPTYTPLIVQPAGVYSSLDPSTWSPLVRLAAGINAERVRTYTNGTASQFVHPGGWFEHVGDILSVPELTDRSPFLSVNTNSLSLERGVNDVAYEWLPQQVMSLLHLGEPRFVIYAYGQALRPAENSIVTANGPFVNLCTNYQITAEVAARAVVRVEGSANPNDASNPDPKRHYPPRLVVESYNYLAPE
jgi:hypothetical protein